MKYPLAIATLIFGALLPGAEAAALQEYGDPLQSARWPEMEKHFLQGQLAVFDPRVRVIVPSLSENPMQVPVTVDATALPGVQEVVVFADFNPLAEVLRFYPEAMPAYLGFRIKLQQSSPVRAAARTRDGVWHVGGSWVNTVGGGCSAPSLASASNEWQARLNQVSGRLWPDAAGGGRLRLRIVHPMDTGLVAGIPAFFLETIVLSDVAGKVLMRILPQPPLSENPVFTLQHSGQALQVSGRDNNGNALAAGLAP